MSGFAIHRQYLLNKSTRTRDVDLAYLLATLCHGYYTAFRCTISSPAGRLTGGRDVEQRSTAFDQTYSSGFDVMVLAGSELARRGLSEMLNSLDTVGRVESRRPAY